METAVNVLSRYDCLFQISTKFQIRHDHAAEHLAPLSNKDHMTPLLILLCSFPALTLSSLCYSAAFSPGIAFNPSAPVAFVICSLIAFFQTSAAPSPPAKFSILSSMISISFSRLGSLTPVSCQFSSLACTLSARSRSKKSRETTLKDSPSELSHILLVTTKTRVRSAHLSHAFLLLLGPSLAHDIANQGVDSMLAASNE